MNEGEGSGDARSEALDLDIHALLNRVSAAMVEIEQAKRERSTEEVRTARTQLAALHGVARLRRLAERRPHAA
jgi:hypothetical protein